MGKIRNLLRRVGPRARKCPVLVPELTVNCGESNVTGIICIANDKIIGVSTDSGFVFIYEYSTDGEPIRFFDSHRREVRDMVHVSHDIIASVDDAGTLLTWFATTGTVMDQLKVSEHECWRTARASSGDLLVGTAKGEIIIVGHDNGASLTVQNRFIDEQNVRVWDVYTYKDTIVIRAEYHVEIRNCSDGKLLHTIRYCKARKLAVNEDFVLVREWMA